MILSCNNISKSFGVDTILENVSFNLEERDKAAIVGINGAGKSTLLKIIMGISSADSGTITIAKDATIGYLSQHQELNSDNTIYDELLNIKKDIIDMEHQLRRIELDMQNHTGSALEALMNTYTRVSHEFEMANGYAYKSEISGVLKGLGFLDEDFNKQVNTLSGGQKTRVALSKLLLIKPDIILLDEPTNHLDLSSITWLETYLSNYPGAVIVVSHDRYFLDKIINKVIGIENRTSMVFSGNYTDFAAKRKMIFEAKLKEYYNTQREIKHQEEVIAKLKQFNREKSIKRAESREKLLNKITPPEKPLEDNSYMRFKLEPEIISGNDVLAVSGLQKSFDSNILFSKLNLDIKRGEHVALIGNNGTGKSTILKIVTGLIDADDGEIHLGSNVTIGYYDQEHNVLNKEKTIFDEIRDTYPDLDNTKIRNVLAAFLFTGDDVFKQIKDLSGGEKGRISLAKLMLSKANLLILDEPTNHLDISSKEILENALNNYSGTIFYVSHDRYFINSTASRIIELSDQKLINYLGNYDYYLEKKNEAALTEGNVSSEAKNSTSKDAWKALKEEQNRLKRLQTDLNRTETEIASIEARISEIDVLSSSEEVACNLSKLMELHTEKEDLTTRLSKLYDHWEDISIQLA